MATTTIRAQLMSTGMIADENLRLQTERDRLEQEIAALSAQTPEQAKRLIEQADKLMEKRDDEFAELRKRRDAIDEQFQVTSQRAAETAERDRLARRQALANEILNAENDRLAALDRAESSLRACIAAIHSALTAGKIANEGTKKLSHGQWSSWAEQDLVARLSQRFAQTMIHEMLNGRGALGLHCKFVPPPNMPSRASEGDPSWRQLEERKMAPVIGNVLAEVQR